MRDMLPRTLAILADLVAIPSIPGAENETWLGYVQNLMTPLGARISMVPSPSGTCTGLIASIGPNVPGGLVLSGHMDVVDVVGQPWVRAPFRLSDEGARLYGRGTTDMKGFNACALAMMECAARLPLRRPLHLVLSADEETSCRSAVSLAAHIAQALPPVRGVLVGEPSGLRPVNRHKGSYTYLVEVMGRSAHASQPELGVSATALAARLMVWLEDRSARSAGPGATTHSVGTVSGGTANNIIAEQCRFEWDIRLAPLDDLAALMDGFQAEAARLLAPVQARAPEAGVRLTQTAVFPGFQTLRDSPLAQECLAASGQSACDVMLAGTEAGIFQQVGLPVMIMGPGALTQAHIPDEYIARSELEGCLTQLSRMVLAQ